MAWLVLLLFPTGMEGEPRQYSPLTRAVFAGFLATFLGLPATVPIVHANPSEETTKELILKLGSKLFKVREEATRQLLLREEAIPALRAALQSTDREVYRRATFILEKLEQLPLVRLE